MSVSGPSITPFAQRHRPDTHSGLPGQSASDGSSMHPVPSPRHVRHGPKQGSAQQIRSTQLSLPQSPLSSHATPAPDLHTPAVQRSLPVHPHSAGQLSHVSVDVSHDPSPQPGLQSPGQFESFSSPLQHVSPQTSTSSLQSASQLHFRSAPEQQLSPHLSGQSEHVQTSSSASQTLFPQSGPTLADEDPGPLVDPLDALESAVVLDAVAPPPPVANGLSKSAPMICAQPPPSANAPAINALVTRMETAMRRATAPW